MRAVALLIALAACGPAPLEVEAEPVELHDDARAGPCPWCAARDGLPARGRVWHGCWCRAPSAQQGPDFVFAVEPVSAERTTWLRALWVEYRDRGCRVE